MSDSHNIAEMEEELGRYRADYQLLLEENTRLRAALEAAPEPWRPGSKRPQLLALGEYIKWYDTVREAALGLKEE